MERVLSQQLAPPPREGRRSADRRGFLAALAITLAALALTLALHPLVDRHMVGLFLGAITLSAWYGGARAGGASVGVTLLAGGILVSITDDPVPDALGIAVVALAGVFVTWLVHRVDTQRGALGASQAHFRELVEGATDYALIGLDPHGAIVTWNRGAERLWGYTEAEAAGRHVSLFLPRDQDASGDDELARAAAHGRFTDEGWRLRKDGSRFWASVLVAPLRDADGALAGFTHLTRDLTERRRAEEELRDREARLASIVGSAMDAIITTDGDRRILLFNAAAETMFGVPAAQAIGEAIDRFVPERFRPGHARQMEGFGREGASSRTMHGARGALPALRADGSEFPVEATISTSVVGGQRLFTAVLRDVTERVAAERERDRLIAELEASGRAKSEFLATMSHELRTPINAIVGYADLMELGIAGELTPQQAAYLGRVRASSQHLRGLIDDVLDMARVEAGRLEVRAAEEPLVPAVRQATELVAPQAAARNVGLSEAEVHPIRYRGDGDRVRQVLVNLLGNAVKFTPPGGSISVRSRVSARTPAGTQLAQGPWVGVEVRDTGIGIPEDEIERIFEPFTQVDQAYTREHGGTGLGLAISRRLARRMGGDLTARSEPGQGSCFTLWLPAVAAPELVIPPDEPVQWPMRPGEVPGLYALGRLLSDRADDVVRAWADRLAAEADVPGASGLDRAQLENHVNTILVELAKELINLDEGGGEPALMRDGTDIQHLIATRHGEQRARLGWAPVHVRREYEMLREEVVNLLATSTIPADADPHAAHAILMRLLYRAEELSVNELGRSS